MAGPWEQYQATDTGPWAEFAKIKTDGNVVKPPVAAKVGMEGFGDAMRDVVKDAGWGARNMAAAGTRFSNLAEGVKQPFGASDPATIEGYRVLEKEAPLGAVAGNIAMLAPTSMIPGANTVAGAGLVSATAGLLSPTMGDESRLKNAAVDGVLGAGGQKLGGLLGDVVQGRAVQVTKAQAQRQAQNSVRDTTLRNAQDAGYVVPPSAAGDGFVTRRLESIAGKAAIGQEAAVKNQAVTDTLARQAAGLGPDEAISRGNLKIARERIAAPYREVAAVDAAVAADLEAMKQARYDAKLAYKHYGVNKDPATLKQAEALKAKEMELEGFIAAALNNAGKPDLLRKFAQARADLAKNFQVQEAVNVGSGQVDASVIGRALDRGAPLSGELDTIGRFQQAFPAYAREGGIVPTPGVSKSEAILASLLAGGGAAAFGPVGVAAAALPLLSTPIRSGLLSGPGQSLLSKPSYTPGLLSRAAGNIMTPEALGLAARGGLLTAQ
jgi:hypothetical protein